ncbi:MAG: aldo/keto reductase [Haloarculaceae archaeon]
MATKAATWDYRDEHGDDFARTYFRRCGEGVVSSIGVGTYLGDPTEAVDDGYREAVVAALERGVNVVDTAINYRCQRSERVVGDAIERADVDREAVFVATKGGFLPFDGQRPSDPGQYLREEFVDSGVVDSDDLVAGQHCIAPDYVEWSLERSLSNLDLETIDLYYVHNPETQLEANPKSAVYDQLEATFTRLEHRRAEGDVRHYGVATWDAFRVPRENDAHLSLSEVVDRARAAAKEAGNAAMGLRAIQVPFNVVMADAFTVASQPSADGDRSVLWLAHESGLDVFTSASLAQGRLATAIPDDVASRVAGETAVQQALNFARSGPGVTCALVGTSSPDHVDENVAAGTHEPLGADAFDAVFE